MQDSRERFIKKWKRPTGFKGVDKEEKEVTTVSTSGNHFSMLKMVIGILLADKNWLQKLD